MAFTPFFCPMKLSRRLYDPLDYVSPLTSTLGLLDSLLDQTIPITQLMLRPNLRANVDSSGKAVDIAHDPNKFQVMVNVKQFKPDEISVKVVDNYIVIHGKHEETADEHGFISREFTRRYAIPEEVEAEKIQSSLSQDGVLTIQAPKKSKEPLPQNERVVPITMQQTAAVEQQQKLQEQQLQQTQAEETKAKNN